MRRLLARFECKLLPLGPHVHSLRGARLGGGAGWRKGASGAAAGRGERDCENPASRHCSVWQDTSRAEGGTEKEGKELTSATTLSPEVPPGGQPCGAAAAHHAAACARCPVAFPGGRGRGPAAAGCWSASFPGGDCARQRRRMMTTAGDSSLISFFGPFELSRHYYSFL